MTMERKRYRFGSFALFLLVIALIGLYFIFYDDLTVFFTVSAISIFIGGLLWFLARRGLASRTQIMYDNLNKHHSNIQQKYKRDQEFIKLNNKNQEIDFCQYCGHKLDKDSTYCSNCGKEI